MSKTASRVFLSYARGDRESARRIADRLRQAGLEVWDPEREILPGSEWTSELQTALDSADALVALISPEAMATSLVTWEIEYALGAKRMRGRLIPVFLRRTNQAPWILKHLQPLRYESPGKTGRQIVDLLSRPAEVRHAKARI